MQKFSNSLFLLSLIMVSCLLLAGSKKLSKKEKSYNSNISRMSETESLESTVEYPREFFRRWLNQPISLQSYNFPDNFIRHRDSNIWSESGSGDLYNKDATFYLRPALNGKQGHFSFESFNFPGHFIRHSNYFLYTSRFTNDHLFRNDASFNIIDSNLNEHEVVSIESSNFPGHYIRHQNARCRISQVENSDLFNKDSAWEIIPGLAQ